MERLSEMTKNKKMAIIDISEYLPNGLQGFITSSMSNIDTDENAIKIVSKIASTIYSGTNKKIIFVKDPETQSKLLSTILSHLKQVAIHLATEVRLLNMDSLALIIHRNKQIEGLAYIVNEVKNPIESDELNCLTIMVIDRLESNEEVNIIIEYSRKVLNTYVKKLYKKSLNAHIFDDVRFIIISIENRDVIRVKLKEEYGRTTVLRLPVVSPQWSINDLPDKLKIDIETLIVDPFVIKARYAPRGILLIGPSGVGKSVTAEAIAQALAKGIVRLTPSTYRSMWYGMTEKMLNNIFSSLKKRKDIVVLVDDADFLVQRFSAIHEAYIAEVNIWLNILQDPSRPLIIMTTNVPEIIDQALIRPGRLDVVIFMGYPDKYMRRKIVKRICESYSLTIDDQVVEEIVKKTRWFNAAELDSLLRMAASKGHGIVNNDVVLWALKRFYINEPERKAVQENLRYYTTRFSNLVLTYLPNEYEI